MYKEMINRYTNLDAYRIKNNMFYLILYNIFKKYFTIFDMFHYIF